jgi:cell division septation protein DedD
MEEQTWKSHAFTLVVFTGTVVLCSIFFILGMLVGHAQAQKPAAAAAAQPAAATDDTPVPKEESPEFTFYDSVKKAEPERVPEPLPEPPVEAQPAPENSINYQIGAVRRANDAERLLEQVKKQGFKAFILAPPPDDPNPYFRVQVGPVTPVQAQQVRRDLEAKGYQPILKR